MHNIGFTGGSVVKKKKKNLPANAGDTRHGFDPSQEDPLEEEKTNNPVFLPEKFHGQRSLVAIAHRTAKCQT